MLFFPEIQCHREIGNDPINACKASLLRQARKTRAVHLILLYFLGPTAVVFSPKIYIMMQAPAFAVIIYSGGFFLRSVHIPL